MEIYADGERETSQEVRLGGKEEIMNVFENNLNFILQIIAFEQEKQHNKSDVFQQNKSDGIVEGKLRGEKVVKVLW